MSKILILAGKISDKKQKFIELVRKEFKDKSTEIKLGNINDAEITISQNKLELIVEGQNITNFDIVYLRGIAGDNIFRATLVAIILDALRVKYFDELYATSGPHRTKLGSLALMAANNLPIPKTVFFTDRKYPVHFEELSKKLGLPFVAKEMSLQRGKGVFLIKGKGDLENLPAKSDGGSENEFFFQEFVDKDHEYRILVLGEKVGVWEEKVRTNEKEFRNNVAVGAEELFFDAEKIPYKLSDVAIAAARVLNVQIAGVDVMTDGKSGRVYILEVNRGPGLTYPGEKSGKVSPEFAAVSKFLEESSK